LKKSNTLITNLFKLITNYLFYLYAKRKVTKQLLYSEFFLRLAIGFYMLILQPPVNFCSDENIQTIFGIKLKDFLNYRIDYNSISQTVEKVVKKIFLGRRNNSTSSGRQSSAVVGSTSTCMTISNFGRFRRAKKYFFHNFFDSLRY
jgi:hypothetical protein